VTYIPLEITQRTEHRKNFKQPESTEGRTAVKREEGRKEDQVANHAHKLAAHVTSKCFVGLVT